jgi:hypothetical protein
MRRSWVLLVAFVLVLGVAPMASASPTTVTVIVTLSPDAGPPAEAAEGLARQHQGRVGFVYEHALQGFSAEVPRTRVDAMARSRGVLRVEEDGPVSDRRDPDERDLGPRPHRPANLPSTRATRTT